MIPNALTGLTRSIESFPEFLRLRARWDELVSASASNEPALSFAWLRTWWEVFGREDDRQLRILLFHEGESAESRLVGAVPLVLRTVRYAGALPFRRLEPVGTGEDREDDVGSEYPGIIAREGLWDSIAFRLAAHLCAPRAEPWDEIVLPHLDGGSTVVGSLARGFQEQGMQIEQRALGVAPFIPLPRDWNEYLARLPRPSRYLVSRSLRDFERWADGAAVHHRVTTFADLERGKDVLHMLHEERWGRGGGAFQSPRFKLFHANLMPKLLAAGALDLHWIEVRGEPVAALYNIVWNGKVYFYQSGRKLEVPRGLRPGIVMHAIAIRESIERGLREYDFLSGSSQYKRQLSLATRPVVTLRIARPSKREKIRAWLEKRANSLGPRLSRFRMRSRSGPDNEA